MQDYCFKDFNVNDVFVNDDASLKEHLNTLVKPIAIKPSNELTISNPVGNSSNNLSISENSAFNKFTKKKRKHYFSESSKVNKKKKKIGPWTENESLILQECMETTPKMSWVEIYKLIPGRIGKQIRERWNNVLNPEINKSKFSEKEKHLIKELVNIYGKKWTLIAKELKNGRTDNHVKNYYNSYLLKQLNAKH